MFDNFFTIDRAKIPKGKIRWRGRYYKKLKKFSNKWVNSLDEKSFQRSWHNHFDSGIGCYSIKDRINHIKILLSVFDSLIKKVNLTGKPYQIWLELHEEHSGCNTLYYSTPIDNGEMFGFPFKPDYEYRIPKLEKYLNMYLPNHSLCAVFSPSYLNDKIYEKCYLICSLENGESLE